MKSIYKRKRHSHRFLKFLCIYAAVLTVAIISVWALLYSFIGDYEESRPSNVMDEVVKDMSLGKTEDVLRRAELAANEFEKDTDRLISYVDSKIHGCSISYSKKSGEYSENNPVYLLYADKTPIAKITLKEAGKNTFKFSRWKLGQIYVGNDLSNTGKQDEAVSILVPAGSTVTVNGVTVNDSYIEESDVEFVPCKNVGDYIEKPLKTRYAIRGLMMEPEVKVVYNGNELETEKEGMEYTSSYPGDDDLMQRMESAIIELNHSYGKYIINKGNLSAVTSKMVGNAKEYMSDIPAVWAFLYGKEYVYDFLNEEISNLHRYSDDCFSCDIYYDLYVKWNNGNVTYSTALTYTYVYYDGKWVVADFIIK